MSKPTMLSELRDLHRGLRKEYVDLLHRNNDPQPGDAEALSFALSALGLREANIIADLAVIQRAESLRNSIRAGKAGANIALQQLANERPDLVRADY